MIGLMLRARGYNRQWVPIDGMILVQILAWIWLFFLPLIPVTWYVTVLLSHTLQL